MPRTRTVTPGFMPSFDKPDPLPSVDRGIFESFVRAFESTSGGCVRACHCGRFFYNPDGGWDWEDGELEALRADVRAKAVDWPVQEVPFEGKPYALDCDCWHPRAELYIRWLKAHGHAVAEFLSLEKARARAEADGLPTVREV